MSTAREWIAAHKREFEVVAQQRDADGPILDRALEVVRKFIISRGLILYGGLAIDYALRLRGSHIYPDDERPDFDVYSPRNVDDAYDLADLLVQAGFNNIVAVGALHAQTMRVGTDFLFVADITYAPAEVFARLPVVEYRGIRVLHPDYQRMDMHLAFCFPFSEAPREVIFHRWEKDHRRFNLLDSFYPLSKTSEVTGGATAPQVIGRILPAIDYDNPASPAALSGLAAYGVLRQALADLAAAVGLPENTTAPHVDVELRAEGLSMDLPSGFAWVLASPRPEETFAQMSAGAVVGGAEVGGAEVGGAEVGGVWFEPLMDVRPAMYVSEDSKLQIFSTAGRKLAVQPVRFRGRNLRLVSSQYLLLYFLQEWHAGHAAALEYYLHTINILRAADEILAGLRREGPSHQYACLLASSPFAPSVRTLGAVNHDSAYLIVTARAARAVGDHPPPALDLPQHLAQLLDGLPQPYYPSTRKKARSSEPFDYEANVLFRRAGRRVKGPVGEIPTAEGKNVESRPKSPPRGP